MVIAIDGPAGSGKSTIARLISARLNYTYINSGNLYRAITLGCLRANIKVDNSESAFDYAQSLDIDYNGDTVFLNGEDVTALLHSDSVDAAVAQLSAIVSIRRLVNDKVRQIAARRSAVVEGRDMTTVVFPDAEHRFFLSAAAASRAKRRLEQGVSGLSYQEILKRIEERDEIDRNKAEGRLVIGNGVKVIDTSHLTVEQTYEKLIQCIECKG
jgi:cytidylate kinase